MVLTKGLDPRVNMEAPVKAGTDKSPYLTLLDL